ncbi:MAG TPA: hypothetical protein VFZ59_22730 [Verrucomicrobiae bacterium]|nr:hypothetical protein [Verrucomicrobiae bacterium]
MKSLWLGVFLLALTARASPTNDLIAHFPLSIDGVDAPGLNPPATLRNASISNGVLFLNGHYDHSGTSKGFRAVFPIPRLQYESFTVSVDFWPLTFRPHRSLNAVERRFDSLTRGRYSQWLELDRSDNSTILVGGTSYRWLGFSCQGNALQLTLNNQDTTHRFAGATVSPKRWHNLVCSVDLKRKKIITMLDGRLLETITLPDNFKLDIIGAKAETEDREFSFSNYSNGSVYYGYAANLKVFGRALGGKELAALYSASAAERAILRTPHGSSWRLLGAIGVAMVVSGLLLVVLLKRRHHRQQHGQE